MRVEGVAIVKNEADIIESFVRHHLSLFDRLWVIDNASTDDTLRILHALRDEGLPLHVTEEHRSPHPQEEVMSEVLTGWRRHCDWLFLLDADEFVDCPTAEALRDVLSGLDGAVCHLLPWNFMVPTAADDPEQPDPRLRIRHRRDAPTPHYLSKVLVPRALMGRSDVRVSAGNHHLMGEDVTHAALPGLPLAHFPIRSAEQLARKAVIGAWAIAGRVHRQVGENQHWRLLRDSVLDGRGVTPADLQRAAANYAEPHPWTDWPLVERPVAPAPREPLRYGGAEIPWWRYAVSYADAHFRRLDVRLLDEPLLVKTVHGVVAAPEGDVADLLREFGDMAPDLRGLAGCLVDPGDVVVHHAPGAGYLTVGLARVAPQVLAVADQDEDWLRTNLVLTATHNVRVAALPDAANLLVASEPVLAADRMLLLGGTPPAQYRALPLEVRVEPRQYLVSGEPVVAQRPPLAVTLALRPQDPLCEDLATYLDGGTVAPGQRWEARQVIETLILRRRMRRYKKQQADKPMTPLERRWQLEARLRTDQTVLDLVLAGGFDDVPARLRDHQPDLSDAAVHQLDLQLRHEVVRAGRAAAAAMPAVTPWLGALDPARVAVVTAGLAQDPVPLRPLAEFDPASRVYRKSAGDRVHLVDHPEAAAALLAEFRHSGLAALVSHRLGAPVAVTLESAVAGFVPAGSGVGCCIADSGEVALVEPGGDAPWEPLLTVWLFPATAVPAGQAGLLV